MPTFSPIGNPTTVAFCTINGKYLTLGASNLIHASSDTIGTNEKFQMVTTETNGTVALKAANGQYVSINQIDREHQ